MGGEFSLKISKGFWIKGKLKEKKKKTPICLVEIKQAVWDCESFKSLGTDDINFWVEIKDDMMCFLSEFHRNGNHMNDINCTFISLIPKVKSP